MPRKNAQRFFGHDMREKEAAAPNLTQIWAGCCSATIAAL